MLSLLKHDVLTTGPPGKSPENIFKLTAQYLESTVVQYNSWHTGTGITWTGKKSYWLEEEEGVGDGRAEGSSEGDGGHTTVSLMPFIDGTHIGIFESLQPEVSNVENSLYL